MQMLSAVINRQARFDVPTHDGCAPLLRLEGALAVVSCVGGFGNQEQMLRINGEANVSAIKTAQKAGVSRYIPGKS